MPPNTEKSHKLPLFYRILTENKIRKKQMIMQELIRIKTANEALYIGRLLPKNPRKRKKRESRSKSLQDKNK